jgi:hypothetical protein
LLGLRQQRSLPNGLPSILQAIFRWFHVIAGITWIGHLYFFNFVNLPFQGGLPKELKPQVNPPLVLRALYFFRWGAMWTFLFGLALFYMVYIQGGAMRNAEGGMSHRGMWILFGMLLGTIMWFNVWFVIWPRPAEDPGAPCWAAPACPAGSGAAGGARLQDQHLPVGSDAVGHDRGLAREPVRHEHREPERGHHPRPGLRSWPVRALAEGADDALTLDAARTKWRAANRPPLYQVRNPSDPPRGA